MYWIQGIIQVFGNSVKVAERFHWKDIFHECCHDPEWVECINESNFQKKPLYVAALDVQKAFDVIDHDSLLRKLYLDGSLVMTGSF